MKLDYSIKDNRLELVLRGDYREFDDETAKSRFYAELRRPSVKAVEIRDDGLKQWDSSLVVVLYEAAQLAAVRKINFNINTLPDNLQRLLHLALAVDRKPSQNLPPRLPWIEALGGWTLGIWHSFVKGLKFMHQTLQSVERLIMNTAVMRRVDFLLKGQNLHITALESVCLIGRTGIDDLTLSVMELKAGNRVRLILSFYDN